MLREHGETAMEILVVLGVIVGVIVLVYRRGQRVQREMGVDADTTSIGDALRARYEQRKVEAELKAAGRAVGDPKLGNAMGRAFLEMSGVCPACHGLVWKEADECGHCGHRLREAAREGAQLDSDGGDGGCDGRASRGSSESQHFPTGQLKRCSGCGVLTVGELCPSCKLKGVHSG